MSKGFDRSKFKGVSSRKRKAQVQEVDKKTKYESESSSREEPLKLVEGKNYIRVMPIHPKTIENMGEDDASNMFPASRFFMDTRVQYEKKNGDQVNEIKRVPHLNSKVHGGTPKDLTDEYINYVHKVIYEEFDGDDNEIKYQLSFLKHHKSGVTRDTKWPCYIKLYKDKKKTEFERGIIYFPSSVIKGMNKQSAAYDDPEDVIETDLFSDIDEGYVMVVTRDEEEGQKDPNNYYSVVADMKGGEDPLSDEDLDWLMEQKPLDEKWLDIYKKSDYEKTLAALKSFDEKEHGNDKKGIVVYDIFSEPEFMEVVEEIAEYYVDEPEEEPEETPKRRSRRTPKSEEDSKEEEGLKEESEGETPKRRSRRATKEEGEPEETPKRRSRRVAKVEESEESDGLVDDLPFDVSLDEMDKEQLEGYIKRNNLPIRVSRRHSKEDLLEFIKDEEAILDQGKEEEESPIEEEAPKRRSRRTAKSEEPEEEVRPRRRSRGRLKDLEEGLED